MHRGEIRWANLDPAQGSEADKTRPVLLVSNDRANASARQRGRGVVTIVPLTSNVARVFPFQVLVAAGSAGLLVDSKVQAEQVRAIDVTRLGDRLGRLPVHLLAAVDEALRLHLDV